MRQGHPRQPCSDCEIQPRHDQRHWRAVLFSAWYTLSVGHYRRRSCLLLIFYSSFMHRRHLKCGGKAARRLWLVEHPIEKKPVPDRAIHTISDPRLQTKDRGESYKPIKVSLGYRKAGTQDRIRTCMDNGNVYPHQIPW